MTFVVIGTLSVNIYDFQLMYGHDSPEIHAHLRGSNNIITIYQIINIT